MAPARQTRVWRWWAGSLVWAVAVPAFLQAADPAHLDDYLGAGEFTKVAELAQSLPADQRDQAWAQLAVAQSTAGARQAAATTLAQVGDDRIRTATLADITASAPAARGAGIEPDFDSLMELIKNTVAPPTWSDVGGPGAMEPFPGGVLVDPEGMLRPRTERASRGRLDDLWQEARDPAPPGSVRAASPLRKVSLPRLERAIQLRAALGRPPTEEMQLLAGLQRVQYVLVYPETGDVVLAGRAGDWRSDAEGRIVSVDEGRPIVRLDDLIVLLRHLHAQPTALLGCSITPTQQGLANVRKYAESSSAQPLKPGEAARRQYLEQLRRELGAQTIEIFGLDPTSRAAQVMVEADYRMKLVGIGLEEGTLEVPSYLKLISLQPGEAPPPLDVLRWWFTPHYQPLLVAADGLAYEIRGQGVRVLSENELLEATGSRVHTGQSHPANQEFAQRFTRHFALLAQRYPVYAELQNVFDLALVASLVVAEGLGNTAGWHMSGLLDSATLPAARGSVPQQVESVVNHRMVGRTTILAAVSGGVTIEPATLVVDDAQQPDLSGQVDSTRQRQPPPSDLSQWWWD